MRKTSARSGAGRELVTYWGHSVDWDEIAAEADVCDEIVTNGEGGTQPRWRIDLSLSDDMEFDTVRSQMEAACDGWIYERPDGKTGLRVGRWIEPTVELTSDDFLTFQIEEGEDLGAPNEFTIQYPEPQNQWKESPSGAWIHDPEGRQVRDEIAVNGCSSHNQASRLNKRRARKTHAQYRIAGKINLAGYDLIGHRFIRVRHDEIGLVASFEVSKLLRNRDLISFQVELISAGAEDFAFDAATEEPARPVYEKIENDGTIDVPVGLTAEAIASTGGTAALLFRWPAQDESYGQQLRYRSEEAGLPDWQVISIPVSVGQTSALVTGLSDGAFYQAQLRNRTGSGIPSDWSPAEPLSVQAIANQTPPAALQSFAAIPEAAQARITFTAPDDAYYYATRIYRADGSTSFGEAELVETQYGLRASPDEWTDTGLAAGDYTYWGEPINTSGIPGPVSAPSTITII